MSDGQGGVRRVASNVERFSGYSEQYDRYRPAAPAMVVRLLTAYLGGEPGLVVDLGCGTGLSTLIWRERAERVIGIEPNAEMLGRAREKLRLLGEELPVAFRQGYSDDTGVKAGTADIVTCSQSFHWMEPAGTLREVGRMLRPGGVFAAYDCDWPPTADAELEARFAGLIQAADAHLAERDEAERRVTKWPKESHLANIQASGEFRFAREVVFHNEEFCDAERYVGLALSQGGLQTVLKRGWTELDEGIAAFRSAAEAYFGGETRTILFGYRMRLGIK